MRRSMIGGVLAAGLLLGCSVPAPTQSVQKDCSSGSVWILDDKMQVEIVDDCEDVRIAGNSNSISAGNIDKLTLMGDGNKVVSGSIKNVAAGGSGNTISYSGSKPKHWFGGDDNKLVQRETTARHAAVTSRTATTPSTTGKQRSASKGSGIKHRQIKEIISNGPLDNFRVIVLLKDGTAVFNPKTPVEHMDVAADQRANPKSWYNWRKSGGALQVRSLSGGKWKPLRSKITKTLKPGKVGMTLNGNWQHARTSGLDMNGGGSSFFANYDFSGNRFEASSSGLMTGGVPGISSSGVASSCTKDGQTSASSSTSVGGGAAGGSRRGSGCGDANVGTYAIKGYTIEFFAADGNTYRKPFYIRDDSTIIVGTRWFASGLD